MHAQIQAPGYTQCQTAKPFSLLRGGPTGKEITLTYAIDSGIQVNNVDGMAVWQRRRPVTVTTCYPPTILSVAVISDRQQHILPQS